VHAHGPSDSARIEATLQGSVGRFALRVDFDVPGRGVTALFGPSGSGKTTCLRALAGLERLRGRIRVGDETWQDDDRGIFVATHRRAIGYVFQDPSLFPHLTVQGNLDYGRRRRAASASDDLRSVVDLLAIGHLLERRPDRLSGGERQRVAIGRALLARPKLLMMDEPMAALDAARRAEILPYLERIRDDSAIPVIYVSHAVDEVSRLADHLVLLDGGRVRASGPTSETLARLDLPVAVLDDAGVVVHARVGSHDEVDDLTRLDLGGASLWIGRVDRAAGARARVRILARDVSLAREPPGPTSVLNVLACRVQELRDDGPGGVTVRLSVEGPNVPLLSRITRRSRAALGLRAGLPVHALVKSVALIA
jgi:molybdate transport system ATP-binding protein